VDDHEVDGVRGPFRQAGDIGQGGVENVDHGALIT
jgi:hypothetical protein